ncbi:MAG: hypothetical protein Q7R40_19490 [Phaeospirillum sp.]|nr:hypothetical protein [Phaeospirillum sp.]
METRSYRCGLLGKAPRLLRGLVARWIAAGQGCDSQAEVGRIFPDRRPPA